MHVFLLMRMYFCTGTCTGLVHVGEGHRQHMSELHDNADTSMQGARVVCALRALVCTMYYVIMCNCKHIIMCIFVVTQMSSARFAQHHHTAT